MRRTLFLMAAVSAVVAITHVPPSPSTAISVSCCPERTSVMVSRGPWLWAVAGTMLTAMLWVVVVVLERKALLAYASLLAVIAAGLSLYYASDAAFSFDFGFGGLNFNLAVLAVAAVPVAILSHVRALRAGAS